MKIEILNCVFTLVIGVHSNEYIVFTYKLKLVTENPKKRTESLGNTLLIRKGKSYYLLLSCLLNRFISPWIWESKQFVSRKKIYCILKMGFCFPQKIQAQNICQQSWECFTFQHRCVHITRHLEMSCSLLDKGHQWYVYTCVPMCISSVYIPVIKDSPSLLH